MSNPNTPEIPENGKIAVATVGGFTVTGAIIGSIIPGAGTVIGAGIGGIIGGIIVIADVISDRE
jgi:hypothetical protein